MILNNFLKNFRNNTGILIRFDDIAPNMNWKMMDKCENLLNQYKIKPVLGVIPNNKDKDLLIYPKRDDFWNTVKKWKSNNWSIAMHGYTHIYDKETNKKDFFGYGGRSEFFGHSCEEQIIKIKNGLKIFQDQNIKITTFFAPNHTYDLNTFKALKSLGIHQIIDGYGLMPYNFKEIKFIPQLFYKLYMLPYGIQSTQIHINYWSEDDFKNFKRFIEKNHKKIINLDYALSINNNNFSIDILNKLIKHLLKMKRKLF